MVITFAFADNVCVCGHMETRAYTIIGVFFSCAHLYGQSGVTRDPHMAWHRISQSGAIILSAMHYGICDRSNKSHRAWHMQIH